ncbi:hypothetical protein [Streptomyces broussonetiae]|uniref:hypothetical protein n=1 Tax=Streptomyces broussonetiae TaxID=2686304 RepID=UPI0035E1ABE5
MSKVERYRATHALALGGLSPDEGRTDPRVCVLLQPIQPGKPVTHGAPVVYRQAPRRQPSAPIGIVNARRGRIQVFRNLFDDVFESRPEPESVQVASKVFESALGKLLLHAHRGRAFGPGCA